MKRLLSKSIKLYLKARYKNIEQWSLQPFDTQYEVLSYLINEIKNTAIGKEYDFESIHSYRDFSTRVPLHTYEQLYPYIHKMMLGGKDILWPGAVNWFAKSSGTTNEKSKYIPISSENLKDCLNSGMWDTLSFLYRHHENPKVFEKKTLIIGGSLEKFDAHPTTKVGDISAIMLVNMPFFSRPYYSPDIDTAIMGDWQKKIDKIARLTISNKKITTLSGVPTWNIVLIKKLLELSGEKNMSALWPEFISYIHGGVNFEPYREQFQSFFPDRKLIFQEVYNASEGYFASQDYPDSSDLMLLLDNGIFYEFIPHSEIDKDNPIVLSLEDVSLGIDYAMVITTNSGLVRYKIGDLVQFTSLMPFKIIITGRTKQYINAFGEEVMIHNTDKALNIACKNHHAQIKDYTVAPRIMDQENKGCHEWIIEFELPPDNIELFVEDLDNALKSLNSDYEAKRKYDMALQAPKVHVVPRGTFENWLYARRRISAQTKVPRLSNDRKYVTDILTFVS